MLPHFLRHYAFAEKIVVYDNASTDRSRELIDTCGNAELRSFASGETFDDKKHLEIKNTAWKESRGQADLVIVCDTDELLHHPHLGSVLEHMKAIGGTLLKPVAFEMVGDHVPAPDESLLASCPQGMRSYLYDKCVVFDPDAIDEIRYDPGCHVCYPQGRVNYFRLPDLHLLHYKWLSLEYVMERYALYSNRLSHFNQQHGIGIHYKWTVEELKQTYERLNDRKVPAVVETFGSDNTWTAPQAPTNLDALLQRGLVELKKGRFEQALADLDEVSRWWADSWVALTGIAVAMSKSNRPYDAYYCLKQAAALTGKQLRGWLVLANFLRRLGYGRLAERCQRKYQLVASAQSRPTRDQ